MSAVDARYACQASGVLDATDAAVPARVHAGSGVRVRAVTRSLSDYGTDRCRCARMLVRAESQLKLFSEIR
jgi:hypothetical protein